jgi:hypothetical protein
MVVLLIASFLIGWLVGAKQEQKRLTKYGTIGSKPKTQTDYQNEHKKIPPCVGHEIESQRQEQTPDRDFMYNWIREKSGKKKNNNDNNTK